MFSYIHIPFCNSKCKYCRFASTGSIQSFQINTYLSFLLSEINSYKGFNDKLDSIYFGGGTPSVLNGDQLKSIILMLKEKFGFRDNIEITLETTPSMVTESNLNFWKLIGINRLSIGIQTLNNMSLIEIGRSNKGDILNSLDIIDNTGFNNVSLDFIIGLPHVFSGEIKDNISLILGKYSFVKHISVYMLEEYYYPGNWDSISIEESEYINEYIDIVTFLRTIGYERYEVSNFSLKGYECKHNKSYWNHSNNLGFGLGAHSYIDGKRFANSDKFELYYKGILSYNEKLTKNDLVIEKIMFGLRSTGLEKDFLSYLNLNSFNKFLDEGYIIDNDNKFFLSDKGVLVLDYILREII